MKNFNGKILFLDRSDINTDEIIPAKYLTELTKAALKPYCLEDLSLPGFDPKKDIDGKAVIVTRANFGCGSSREHAPWVLECNNINLVIAVNFARIFRQNMFNCGLAAISLSPEQIDDIFATFAGTPAMMEFCGISLVTTAPAATMELSPMVTPGHTSAPAPIQTLFPSITILCTCRF